jgi:hypothetical protein
VYRLSGLKVNILDSRSAAVGLMLGNSFYQLCLDRLGRDLIYLMALSFPGIKKELPMYFISSEEGVPRTEMMRCTWSRKSSPGKRGWRPNNSARIQPTDQMSTAFV